jgi:hypothetical protein
VIPTFYDIVAGGRDRLIARRRRRHDTRETLS